MSGSASSSSGGGERFGSSNNHSASASASAPQAAATNSHTPNTTFAVPAAKTASKVKRSLSAALVQAMEEAASATAAVTTASSSRRRQSHPPKQEKEKSSHRKKEKDTKQDKSSSSSRLKAAQPASKRSKEKKRSSSQSQQASSYRKKPAVGVVKRESVSRAINSPSPAPSSTAFVASASTPRRPRYSCWPPRRAPIPKVDDSDSEDFCILCRVADREQEDEEGGELIVCNGICSHCFHAACLKPEERAFAGETEDFWLCPHCAKGELAPYEDLTYEETDPKCNLLMGAIGIHDKQGRAQFIEHLLTLPHIQRQVRKNEQDSFGRTVLHHAAEVRAPSEVVLRLLELGADVNKHNSDQENPIHVAFTYQAVGAILALLTAPDIDLHARARSHTGHAVFAACGGEKGKAGLGPGQRIQGMKGYFRFQVLFSFALIFVARERYLQNPSWLIDYDQSTPGGLSAATALAYSKEGREHAQFVNYLRNRLDTLSSRILEFVYLCVKWGLDCASDYQSSDFQANYAPTAPSEEVESVGRQEEWEAGSAMSAGASSAMAASSAASVMPLPATSASVASSTPSPTPSSAVGKRKRVSLSASASKRKRLSGHKVSSSRNSLISSILAAIRERAAAVAQPLPPVLQRIHAAEEDFERWSEAFNFCPEFIQYSSQPNQNMLPPDEHVRLSLEAADRKRNRLEEHAAEEGGGILEEHEGEEVESKSPLDWRSSTQPSMPAEEDLADEWGQEGGGGFSPEDEQGWAEDRQYPAPEVLSPLAPSVETHQAVTTSAATVAPSAPLLSSLADASLVPASEVESAASMAPPPRRSSRTRSRSRAPSTDNEEGPQPMEVDLHPVVKKEGANRRKEKGQEEESPPAIPQPAQSDMQSTPSSSSPSAPLDVSSSLLPAASSSSLPSASSAPSSSPSPSPSPSPSASPHLEDQDLTQVEVAAEATPPPPENKELEGKVEEEQEEEEMKEPENQARVSRQADAAAASPAVSLPPSLPSSPPSSSSSLSSPAPSAPLTLEQLLDRQAAELDALRARHKAELLAFQPRVTP